MQTPMNLGPQEAFRALADPTRRNILLMLREQDMSIRDVAANFEVTRGAIQKHLAILEDGRLISVRKSGRERLNHLEPYALQAVSDWFGFFDAFWDDRLTNLKNAIEKSKEKS